MQKLGIVTTAILAFPLIASAALPPQYQRQRELQSVITSPDVQEALNGGPIDSVSTDGNDVYLVRSGDCTVSVTIVDSTKKMPAGWAGPRQYELQVGEAICE